MLSDGSPSSLHCHQMSLQHFRALLISGFQIRVGPALISLLVLWLGMLAYAALFNVVVKCTRDIKNSKSD